MYIYDDSEDTITVQSKYSISKSLIRGIITLDYDMTGNDKQYVDELKKANIADIVTTSFMLSITDSNEQSYSLLFAGSDNFDDSAYIKDTGDYTFTIESTYLSSFVSDHQNIPVDTFILEGYVYITHENNSNISKDAMEALSNSKLHAKAVFTVIGEIIE